MRLTFQWLFKVCWICLLCCFGMLTVQAQNGADSTHQAAAEASLQYQKEQQQIDSIIAVALQKQLGQTAAGSAERRQLEDSLASLARKDSARKESQKEYLAALREKAVAHPVVFEGDTLFNLYTRIGSFTVAERAEAVSRRVQRLYDDPFFSPDSLQVVSNQSLYDVVYRDDNIIMSVSEIDA